MNIYQPWTPEDENRLIHLYETADLTVAEIAKDMGRGVGGVRARLGVLAATNRVTRRQPTTLPDDLRNRVLEMYKSGKKYVEIAEETGESYNRISGVITNYRIKAGLRVGRPPGRTPVLRSEDGSPRSTGISALDSALEVLRKELQVLSNQQVRIAEKTAHLRQTISRIEHITR